MYGSIYSPKTFTNLSEKIWLLSIISEGIKLFNILKLSVFTLKNIPPTSKSSVVIIVAKELK